MPYCPCTLIKYYCALCFCPWLVANYRVADRYCSCNIKKPNFLEACKKKPDFFGCRFSS